MWRSIVSGLIIFMCSVTLAQESGTGVSLDTDHCPVDFAMGDEISCVTLTVPENYDLPDGNIIQLPVLIIENETSNAPPLLTISGGPGASLLALRDTLIDYSRQINRTIITLEQRGNAFASPALTCPQLDDAIIHTFETANSHEEEIGGWVDAIESCFQNFRERGINPEMYSTANIVRDMESLRSELDYDQIAMLGLSYGSRYASLYAGQYPENTELLILDSVFPLDFAIYESHIMGFESAFNHLAIMCDTQLPGCASEIQTQFQTAVERLNRETPQVTINHPTTGLPVTISLNGYDFASAIFAMQTFRVGIPLIPIIIQQVARGNDEILVPVAQTGMQSLLNRDWWGTFYVVHCMDEYPFNNPQFVDEDSNQIDFLPQWHTIFFAANQEVCQHLNLPPSSPDIRQPYSGNIPTLILSGAYDPLSPAVLAQNMAQELPQVVTYKLDTGSHVTFRTPCGTEVVASFVANPSRPLRACSQEDEIYFWQNDRIILTDISFQIQMMFSTTPALLTLIIPLITQVFFFIHIVRSAILAVRRRPLTPAFWITTSIAVPGMLSLIGMIQIIKLSPVYILSIGFPIVMIIPAILALTGGIMTIVQFHYLSRVDAKPYPGRGFDILFLIASITYLLWLAGLLIAVVIV